MADFHAYVDLPPILLEQIIAKLDWNSYFRLQQTCRQMEEFVRTSRKLYTRVDKNSNFKWMPMENGEFRLVLEFSNGLVDISGIYGIKLQLLGSPRDMMCDFQEFCETVTKHRITCSILSLAPHPGGFELSKEHCLKLISILKPEEIIMEDGGSDRFEALLYSRNLRRLVVIGMDPGRICSLMDNLVTHRVVQLKTSNAISITPEEVTQILLSVYQFLRFPSRLQYFELLIKWSSSDNFHQQLLQKLCQLPLFQKHKGCEPEYFIEMPSESTCSLIITHGSASFKYWYKSPIPECYKYNPLLF